MYVLTKNYIAAAQFLNLESIDFGITKYHNPETGQTEKRWIETSWMVTQEINSDNYITLACVDGTKGKHGVIMIPPMMETEREKLEVSLRELQPINLDNWDDPVKKALQNINLFPTERHNYIREGAESLLPWNFMVQFSTPFTRGAFGIHRESPDTLPLANVGYSIRKAIQHFGEQYRDNQAIHDYLTKYHLI